MRILTLTLDYPSAARPQQGVAVEGRLRPLLATGLVEARVVAPRRRPMALPARETRHGVVVHHPWAPLPSPLPLHGLLLPALRRLDWQFDLIDAHGLYPVGVAAALLGRSLEKPFVVNEDGGDFARRLAQPLARRLMRWALARAGGVAAGSPSVAEALARLGAPAERLRVLPDGVDLRLFRPGDRMAARLRLGFRGSTLLAVGPFRQRRHDELIVEALALLPDAELVLVGDGPGLSALADLAHRRRVARRIRLFGPLAQEALPEIYRAADILLASGSRTGWPAAALEALACGTPVAAIAATGAAGLLTAPEAGILVPGSEPEDFAAAIARLLGAPPDRAATRAFAERFTWDEATIGRIGMFSAAVGKSPADLAA